ncbi:MAG: T9SS type A sorting domain-containing protein [Prevotella sp.]|nr:T9SS type A sorting domain-containing protein [Prevotella sp.]
MIKKLLVLFTILTLSLMAPVTASASREYVAGVMDFQSGEITVSCVERTLSILGAEGKTVQIVSLTGRVVFEAVIDSPAKKFELDIPKGVYIIKVGSLVRKFSFR